ncbi:cupin domain-containing protein [Epibacterium sp. SM1969]|uniref:Cupin domain-containing protein n=1 Tax=Tritonibacter aquimaris TaxID=2663379 RepID=A0A844B226_9RHOB|nr:XRE family transcriptional regulator [Tritonibacter aquimaris]MQY44402.1 cupin domain-containing protein [Tritonibacter aquimaris]
MLKKPTINTPSKPPLGEALRARRKELKLSMQTVADRAGLSVGFVSQVERGQSAPSLVSLSSIAAILELPLGSLLDQPSEKPSSTSQGARDKFSVADNELVYERLSTTFNHSRLHSLIVHEPPGHRYEPISHPGEELFYMLSGTITIEIDGEVSVLGPGDSIHFDSYRTHSSWNHGSEVASFLWCGTMDVFGEGGTAFHPLHKEPKGGN